MHRNRNGGAIVAAALMVTAVAAIVAGCASSNFKLASQQRTSLQSVTDDRVANAPLETAPKILPETHVAAGRMFEAQRDVPQAILQYRKAIAVNHRNVVAYQRLGYLLGQVGEHAEAIDVLGRAVTLDPNNAVLRNNLGFELMHGQRWKEAEAELRTAIRQRSDFPRAHVNLAMVLSQVNRFDEALSEFQSVLPDADAHYNMGLLHRGQKRYEDAKASFERVLVLNPVFSAARTQLSEIESHVATAPASTGRAEEVVAQTPDHEVNIATPAAAVGFTVTARSSDGYGTGVGGDEPIEIPFAPSVENVARIENKVDVDDDGELATETTGSALDEAERFDADARSSVRNPTARGSESVDWTIPFGLSLARRLSEVRAEGDAVAAKRIGAPVAERDTQIAEVDSEIAIADGVSDEPSPQPSPSKEELVRTSRDPWTEAWVEDLRTLDSRLTVVRNQIACLDAKIARNQAEIAATDRLSSAAEGSSGDAARGAAGIEQSIVTIDETGVYARVLDASGSFGIETETSDTYSSPAIADFSPAEPLASESAAWTTPEGDDAARIAPLEGRGPTAVPVKYDEPAKEPSRRDRRNQGTFLWGPSLDEASTALALARNDIRCRETVGVESEMEAAESWDEIASWPGLETEPTWCDGEEFVPMCDPRWDGEDGGTVKSSQTSMNFARPSDPRHVSPMAD